MKMPVRVPRGRTGGDVLAGIAMTAIGRRDGLRRFGGTRDRLLASLAPLIAFPLVASVMLAASGEAALAGAQFLATLCALLAPLVVSYEFARWWRRTEQWLRFATAFDWCQWAIPVFAVLALSVVTPLLTGWLGQRGALLGAIGLTGVYALWLHWFVARHALGISAWRAVLLVVSINIASAIVGFGPALLAQRGL